MSPAKILGVDTRHQDDPAVVAVAKIHRQLELANEIENRQGILASVTAKYDVAVKQCEAALVKYGAVEKRHVHLSPNLLESSFSSFS
jgi:hypothetical protein